MKFLIFVVIVVLGFFAWPQMKESLKPKKEPGQEMAKIAAEFPMETHWGAKGYAHTDVSYNVKKTDSLINPIIGTLRFSQVYGLDYEYVFHWVDGERWEFGKAICLSNGRDFIDSSMMSGGEMRPFLEKYGWRAPYEERVTPPLVVVAPQSTPRPLVRVAPRATPSIADIERQYGTKSVER